MDSNTTNLFHSITLNEHEETVSANELAQSCEHMQHEEERKRFFSNIDKNSAETLEQYCSAIIVLAQNAETDEFRDELQQFVLKNLSNKSRLVRKTCVYILKTVFLAVHDVQVEEYFVLLSALEESQFHIIEPALFKLTTLADYVNSNKECPLKWQHLKLCFINALHHVNGWIRSSTILRILKLPPELLRDYEFLMNEFFDALCQYDVYWRIEQTCGLDAFIADLRGLITTLLTREFCIKFLNVFVNRVLACPLFFISCSLPQVPKELLDVEDLPLIKQLFFTVDRIAYQKLRYSVFLNFLRFLLCVFKEKSNVNEISRLFSMLPLEVAVRANEFWKEKFGTSCDLDNLVLSRNETSDLVVNDRLQKDSTIQELIDQISTADHDDKVTLIKRIECLYRDAETALETTKLCTLYTSGLLAGFDSHHEFVLKQLFRMLESNERNPQVAFIIASQLKNRASVPIEFYPLLLELAIYGSIPQKFDEVVRLAHEKAECLGLGEMADVHLMRKRTREYAVVTLLHVCFQNPHLIGDLMLAILGKYDQIDSRHKNRSFGLSIWHRQQTRLASLMLLFVGNAELYKHLHETSHSQVRQFCIEQIGKKSQQFSLKLACEWILTIYCLRDAKFYEHWLEQAPNLATQRIGSVSSWISSIVRSLRLDTQLTRERLGKFLIKVLPWTTTHNFMVRILSVASIKMLCNWHREVVLADASLQFGIELADFNSDTLGNTKRIVEVACEEPYFQHLYPEDVDLPLAFSILPKLTGIPKDELIFKDLSAYKWFLDKHRFFDLGLVYKVENSAMFSGLVGTNVSKPQALGEDYPIDDDGDKSFEVQQKIDIWVKQFEKKNQVDEQTQLVVVASLINKATNLGGLCRTSEIFNVRQLVVPNLAVVKSYEFKALSISSEKLLPIIEVRPESVLDYLKKCRSEGFSIVAAEQTSRSVTLEKFSFPPKCVLLLGDEKQGVPPELIRYVDHTIEITQLGVTRSLNVHTTGSIFIYNYAIQHLLPSK